VGAFHRSRTHGGVPSEELKLSGSGSGSDGDDASQMVAEECTYSEEQVVVSGIRMACEGHTTLGLASVLGRWRLGGEESTGMGQEGKRVRGTTATEPLGLAPFAPLADSWVVEVVASQVGELLDLPEQVLVLIEVKGLLVLRVLKQVGRYPKLLLVPRVHVQPKLVWVRARGRKRVQAQPYLAHLEAEEAQPYEHPPVAMLVVWGN